jgi:hypothetical protein
MPLQPFTGTFGTAELRHLLRRTLFGATQEDLTAFQGKTLTQVVDALLDINTNIATPPVFFQDGVQFTRKGLHYDIDGDVVLTPMSSSMGEDWVSQTWKKIGGHYTYECPKQYAFTASWSGNMLHQERTIKEKMILFLHNLVPVNPKNDEALLLYVYEYYKLLNKYALGNYKDFIFEMTFNPMMLIYLDGKFNKANGINENYARELQELFTVGKPIADTNNPSYNKTDIEGIAKLLTGWRLNENWRRSDVNNVNTALPVEFIESDYNNDSVTLSGYYGNITIDQLPTNPSITGIQAVFRLKQALDVIFSKDDVAKHIVRKLYRYFVYSDITTNNLSLCSPNIELNIIEPLAITLKTSGYNLKTVLKELLTSKHFFESINRGCMIKNPMDFVVGTLRMFKVDRLLPEFKDQNGNWIYASKMGYKSIARYTFWMDWVDAKCHEMNWGLLNAPDVAGLPAYHQASSYHQSWINADTVNKRKKFLGLKLVHGLLYYAGFDINAFPTGEINYIPDFEAVTKSIVSSIARNRFNASDANFDKRNAFIDIILDHFLAVRPNNTTIDSIKNLGLWNNLIHWNQFKVNYNDNTLSANDKNGLSQFYTTIVSLEEFQLM